MSEDLFFEIHRDLAREGPGRDEYTRKAFEMLPTLERPRILDVGCGPGGPTLELARLSGGDVVGLDTHQPYLDRLAGRAEEEGLADRVEVVNCSMSEIGFPDACFDVVWAEGSIYIIGFEKGLREWRRFVRPNGFLAVTEMAWLRPEPPQELYDWWMELYPGIRTVPENLELVSDCGYDLIEHFTLPEDAWWCEYYWPLERRLQELGRKYADDAKALALLEQEQVEIDMFRKYQRWYGSVFFVMEKTNA